MHSRSLAGLLVILLTFLVFQLFYLSAPHVLSDETLFAWNTSLIRSDLGSVFDSEMWQNHPPLIPVVASLLPFSPLISLRVISILSGLLVLILTFWLGKKWGNSVTGLFAAALLSVVFAFTLYSHYGVLDLPLLAGLMMCIYCLVRGFETQRWGLFAIILLVSFLIKTRAALIILPIIVCFFVLHYFSLAPKSSRENSHKLYYYDALLFLGAMGALLVLYLFWRPATVSLSSWSLISGVFISLLPLPAWGLVLLSFIRQHPPAWFENVSLFWIAWAASMIVLISFYGDALRFFLVGLPILCIRAAMGFEFFREKFLHIFSKKVIYFLAIFALFLPMFAGNIIQLNSHFDDAGHPAVAEWTRGVDNAVIYTGFSRELRFYSGEPFYPEGKLRLYPYTSDQMLFELSQEIRTVYAIVGPFRNPFYGTFVTEDWLRENGFVEHARIAASKSEWIVFRRV